MAWILNLCLVIIFLVCLLMSLASGLWGNLIMVFNVILAALIATNYFEPLAGWLDGRWPAGRQRRLVGRRLLIVDAIGVLALRGHRIDRRKL